MQVRSTTSCTPIEGQPKNLQLKIQNNSSTAASGKAPLPINRACMHGMHEARERNNNDDDDNDAAALALGLA